MTATYLLRKHLATMRSAATPQAVAERKLYSKALALAKADQSQKFPIITPDNFEAAYAYINERIAYHRESLT